VAKLPNKDAFVNGKKPDEFTAHGVTITRKPDEGIRDWYDRKKKLEKEGAPKEVKAVEPDELTQLKEKLQKAEAAADSLGARVRKLESELDETNEELSSCENERKRLYDACLMGYGTLLGVKHENGVPVAVSEMKSAIEGCRR
jgi:hypothetical protein